MLNEQQKKYSDDSFGLRIGFALLSYLLLLIRWGYSYGLADQVELLPYILYLSDNSLYPHDFFIQGMLELIPNERHLFSLALSPFVGLLKPLCLLLHIISSLLLLTGMERIAARFIEPVLLRWFTILLCLIPLYDWSLGGVELYYNTFQASNLAKGIAIWGLHWFLQGKYKRSVLLISLVTYIQIITGLTLMIAFGAVLVWRLLFCSLGIKQFIQTILIYVVLALPFLALILGARTGDDSVISKDLFFEALYVFRHAHHFIFTSFSLKKIIFFFGISAFAIWYYSKTDFTVFQLMTVSITLLVFYIIAVDLGREPMLANFQWYKMTIWMKFIALVAIISALSKVKFIKALTGLIKPVPILAIGSIMVITMIGPLRASLPWQVPFHIGGTEKVSYEIDICRQIEQKTAKDAVFVQPFDVTALKFFGKRSSYVEFKANVRNAKHVAIWLERIEATYDIAPGNDALGFALQEEADRFYYSRTSEQLISLRNKGVTHLLTRKEHVGLNLERIVENEEFVVYEL